MQANVYDSSVKNQKPTLTGCQSVTGQSLNLGFWAPVPT